MKRLNGDGTVTPGELDRLPYDLRVKRLSGLGTILWIDDPMSDGGHYSADRRGHDEQPDLAQGRCAHYEGRPEAPGPIDRCSGERDANQVDEGEHEPDHQASGDGIRDSCRHFAATPLATPQRTSK
jgi:hypothetical protein